MISSGIMIGIFIVSIIAYNVSAYLYSRSEKQSDVYKINMAFSMIPVVVISIVTPTFIANIITHAFLFLPKFNTTLRAIGYLNIVAIVFMIFKFFRSVYSLGISGRFMRGYYIKWIIAAFLSSIILSIVLLGILFFA